jgi:branched-chain amino acid transport system substrate-binding protein
MRSWLICLALFAVLVPMREAIAQSAGDPTRIGILTDMAWQVNFRTSPPQGSVTAGKMAVEDFRGKVLGLPIEDLVADHQNRTRFAIAKARVRYDVQKIDLITNLINPVIALSGNGAN